MAVDITILNDKSEGNQRALSQQVPDQSGPAVKNIIITQYKDERI